jgi:hypothetical protein
VEVADKASSRLVGAAAYSGDLFMNILLFLGSLALAFVTATASAADPPPKAPSYAGPAASPWTGFYLCGGIGFRTSQMGERTPDQSFAKLESSRSNV